MRRIRPEVIAERKAWDAYTWEVKREMKAQRCYSMGTIKRTDATIEAFRNWRVAREGLQPR